MFYKIGTVWYILKRGLCGLKQNITYAIASSITMTICILLFGIFSAVCMNVDGMMKDIESKLTITVLLQEDIPDKKRESIGDAIKNNTDAEEVNYISGEQAWEEYKKEYFDGKEELAEGFGNDNPLKDSGHYDVSVGDVSKQRDLVNYISTLDGVRQINQSEQVASIFTDINKVIAGFSGVLILIMAFMSLFLIQNTVNAGISARKEELSIMKVLGATEWFIQLPFIIEGFIIGILGSCIPLIIFSRMYDTMMKYVESHFLSLGNFLNFVEKADVFQMLIPISLCMGIGIGLIGSMLTLHRKLGKA